MTPPSIPRGSVALTGASGFVGGHIQQRLVAAGWHVKALTRRPGGLAEAGPAVTPVQGDLESGSALSELVSGVDAVIHCAGLVAARKTGDFHRVNTQGTENLLRAATAGGNSPRFILISSLAAREPQISPYAHSKRQAEEHLRQVGAGLDWQILRPPVVYGPGDRATLPLFRQFTRGLVLRPSGDGRFSMIYVEDLAAAASALLEQGATARRVMELDDGTAGGYGWNDVLATAERPAAPM